MKYEEFKQKVRRYLRDDVLIQSSFLNWKAWEVDAVPEWCPSPYAERTTQFGYSLSNPVA
ncbi:MAG: hypothetical protein IPM97_06880 [Bdellovibrionaceae bacterium]|nr:hypothetical protein [Pseudobdellovibrionaceae bacterium]